MNFKQMQAFKKSLTILSKMAKDLASLSYTTKILGQDLEEDEKELNDHSESLKNKFEEAKKIIYEKSSMAVRESKLRKLAFDMVKEGLLDDDPFSKV